MLTPGDNFGTYRIVREIGRGAMGAVFEAEHLQLHKRVAIKVLLPDAAAEREAVQRFLREGEAAARIRHEHIVDVSDVGMRDGVSYLVMELLDGETLAQRLARKGPFGDTELVDLMIPVCDALAVAHESGVIHRDVKPENIFLARTRRGTIKPKLVDFGISHVQRSNDPKIARLTSSAILIGTPCYLSPEAARSAHKVDARSDQYAFGVTLFECRTGTLPYERTSVFEMISAILLEEPPPPSERVAGIDPRLEAVILRAMSRSPSDRFPDMRALARALLPLASPSVRTIWEVDLRSNLHSGPRIDPGPGSADHVPGSPDAVRETDPSTSDAPPASSRSTPAPPPPSRPAPRGAPSATPLLPPSMPPPASRRSRGVIAGTMLAIAAASAALGMVVAHRSEPVRAVAPSPPFLTAAPVPRTLPEAVVAPSPSPPPSQPAALRDDDAGAPVAMLAPHVRRVAARAPRLGVAAPHASTTPEPSPPAQPAPAAPTAPTAPAARHPMLRTEFDPASN